MGLPESVSPVPSPPNSDDDKTNPPISPTVAACPPGIISNSPTFPAVDRLLTANLEPPSSDTPDDRVSLHIALQNLSVDDVSADDKDFPVHHLASDPLTLGNAIYNKFNRSSKHTHVITSFLSLDLGQLYADRYQYLCTSLNIPLPTTPVMEDNPTSWRAAMASANRSHWLKAADDKLRQIVSMGTFELTDSIPPGRRALPSKWVWKAKKHPDGSINKFKARWVVCGDLQRKGVDYFETFAPVANLISLRILLTVVCIQDLELDQLDMVSAFLNGVIDTTVFLHQPQGFSVRDGHYCILCKSLYGLCQAARTWYDRLDNVLRGRERIVFIFL